MLVIAGQLNVDPKDRESYVAACAEVVEQARSAEGCLDFAITGDSLDDGRVNIFERWESDETLHAFRDGGSGPDLPPIRESSVAKYRISATEEP